MATITQNGLVIGPSDILESLPKASRKVASWQDRVSPATARATYAAIKASGAYAESIFDAAHGRRYCLFVYRDKAERVACFDYHCRPGQ